MMVTIKILDATRKVLRRVSTQTGEKQYALINRLAVQENKRIDDLERASRLPKDLGRKVKGKKKQ